MNFIHNNEDTVMYQGEPHRIMGRFHNDKEDVYSNKGNSSKNMYFLIPTDPIKARDDERFVWVPESQITSV